MLNELKHKYLQGWPLQTYTQIMTMKFSTNTIKTFFFAFTVLFTAASCVDQDFDAPPAGGFDPNLATNATIADLKALHVPGDYVEITDDLVIDALVISSDEAGNFFKQLVIQDETGGIEIRIDVANLHNEFPVGRKIYLKAKGLWISDYNGLIQLGAGEGVDDDGDPELIRIPQTLVDNFFVKATFGNPVIPKIKTIDELTLADVSTLIQFDGVQFINADAGEIYADSALTKNMEVEDCADNTLILRNSGFADFRAQLTPTGNGTLVGILGVFRDDYQFMIRDLADVNMTGDRCGGGGGGSLTVAQVRQAFSSGSTTAPNGTVKGIVISDYTTGNVVGLNLYIQDATGGIVLRFDDDHGYELGDEITVDVSGGALSEFNGLLQVSGLDVAASDFLSHPGDVTPRAATVAEILANAQAWESTLVQINDVTLSGGTTFNGSITVTDATGAMIMFTRSAATFSGTALPSGEITLTAIVSEFNAPQLIIRNLNDVGGGGGPVCTENTAACYRERFNAGTTNIASGTLEGVVISDRTTESVHGLSVYVQDATGGIVVRMTGDHTFALGELVSFNLAGGMMSEFNGLLQINGIDPTDGTVISQPGDVTPRTATIAEVLANAEAWESTLVRINNVTLSGASTFSGAVTVTDATGTITMFTRSAATFSGTTLPSGTVDLIAIVSEFTETQLIIRSPADVQ
jgi:hypothetical protein